MGEPLSPDHVFDFPVDEPEPHLTYDFFAPGPLPGYAGNPNNNNNRWLEADDYLLGELEAMVDEPMVIHAIEEVAELVAEVEEEQVIDPADDMEEGQMDARVIDIEEDLAVLFGDDDFEDDASDGFDDEEVWEKLIQVSDAEVAAGVTIGEIGPRIFAVKGHGQQTKALRDEAIAELTQQVQALQADVQHRDTQIQQL
ncbi:hypothetical protein Tco_0516646 [Tanacetum coccineum]